MNAKKITLILIPINIILAFFVYDSITSEVEFNKQAKERIAENVQKLKDLRTLQIAYKKENDVFADNFNSLLDFLENDSTTIIKSVGEKCKVSIRNIRREANEDLKKLLKSKDIGEDEEKTYEKPNLYEPPVLQIIGNLVQGDGRLGRRLAQASAGTLSLEEPFWRF